MGHATLAALTPCNQIHFRSFIIMAFPPPFYRWRPHPWHGLETGPNPPQLVYAYIEITPFDLMKYEIDKVTGYLRVDRPQRSSSQPPALYGFIPRTYCDKRVAKLSQSAETGDGDPLDICVVSERPINRSEVILTARIVGGLDVNDGGEADDKIIAVLQNDNVWGKAEDITDLPEILVERLSHYFATYKMIPGEESMLRVERTYNRDHAHKVVEAAMADYYDEYGG
jgi:inorganic pyrophosphatase